MKKIKCLKCDTVVDFPNKGMLACKCENLTLNAEERIVVCNGGETSFCAIDDEGNHILNQPKEKPTKQELLILLKGMRENIESLPPNAQASYITHYDLISLILLLEGLFAAD